MNNLPTLKQLQYLVALSEEKNFRKAAEKCHVSQPTLSAAIKEMESLIGADVLDRGRHKKVIFTPFGQSAIKTAKSILPQMEQMRETAKNLSAPLSGPIRLGLIPTIAPYLLPTILPSLQKQYPNIEWQISEGMSATLVERMNEGTIDIAIIAFPFDIGDLKHQIFFEENFICAAKAESFNKSKTITLEDLEEQNILLLEDGHCLRDHALSACKLRTNKDKQALSATSLQTLIQMVDHGYGITLLPNMMVKDGALPPNIALYDFKKPKPTRKIGMIWRGNSPLLKDITHINKFLSTNL